jgi:hypothetical protein
MRKKIGELLVESGAVTEAKVRNALGHQKAFGQGQRLGSILVSMGLVSPSAVARALATQFDLPFVELPEISPEVSSVISAEFQTEHRVVPFRVDVEGRSERLHIAVEDPADLSVVDELRFNLRKQIRVYVAAADDIESALAAARGEKLDVVEAIALEDDAGAELAIERDTPGMASMVAGGRFDPSAPKPAAPTAGMSPLEWELPEPTPAKPPPPPPPPPPARAAPPAPPPPPPTPPPASEASTLASADFLDALLGPSPKAPPSPPPPPQVPDPTTPRVPVVVFGGAAKDVKPPPLVPPPDFSEADLQVLDNLERMASGQEATLDSEKVKPARMVAALIRLLIKKGVIQEMEFLEELARK